MIVSTFSFIMYFIMYIILHTLIGYKLQYIKKELEEKPGNQKLMDVGKKVNILFKWFPAIYLIFVVLMFYFF